MNDGQSRWTRAGKASRAGRSCAQPARPSGRAAFACFGTSSDCGTGSGAQVYPEIVTDADLRNAKFAKVNGVCYSVSVNSTAKPLTDAVTVDGTYSTCTACLAAPIKSAKHTYITAVSYDEGTGELSYASESILIRNGLIIGFCKEDDIVVTTAEECPEGT